MSEVVVIERDGLTEIIEIGIQGPPGVGGDVSFLDLTDAPDEYGTPGQSLVVNASGDGLEFATPAGGGDMLRSTYDTNNNGIVDNAAALAGTTPTAAGLALLSAANAAAQRTNLGLLSAATLNAPASGDAASGEVVKGNDSRLSDSRTPTTHTHPASGISDSTSAGRTLLTAADAAAQRAALELGTAATTAASAYAAAAHSHTGLTAQSEATWEAGTGTDESVVSPAKIAAAIAALAPSGGGGGSDELVAVAEGETPLYLIGNGTNGALVNDDTAYNALKLEVVGNQAFISVPFDEANFVLNSGALALKPSDESIYTGEGFGVNLKAGGHIVVESGNGLKIDIEETNDDEMEAGTEVNLRLMSPAHIAYAIAALAPSGGGQSPQAKGQGIVTWAGHEVLHSPSCLPAQPSGAIAGLNTANIGVIYYHEQGEDETLASVMVRCTATGTAGAKAVIAFYQLSDGGKLPATLLIQSAAISNVFDSTGEKSMSESRTLPAGKYLVVLALSAGGSLRGSAASTMFHGISSDSSAYTAVVSYITLSPGWTTLPSTINAADITQVGGSYGAQYPFWTIA